ncbi:MAG: DUF1549 and DUF1553 domain-containing protein [Bacteroidales bacterium]|nr:DUF1549 and DUF1553 domain-containing protein [Bacteroidales bacterium]
MLTHRITLTIVLVFAGFAPAVELLPANKPIETVIDLAIQARLQADGVQPAPQADDATLIRRLTLDLVGRIPTLVETDDYVGSSDPNKRAKLVDRLMASPGFVRFQAEQLDVMLNSTVAGDDRRQGSVRNYLRTALADGKTWDQIFRDLMLPNEDDPKTKSAVNFLKARARDTDRLTNDVSVAFFGVNVSCAQCHDHPLVADWKQDHFYGMKSFLDRTYEAGNFLAERGAGLVKFKPTRGPERSAQMMFLTGTIVDSPTVRELTKDEQKREKELIEKAKQDKKAPPAPPFSARAQLVELALKPKESQFFARSIVNRLWYRLLGYGLVMPLDQMHSENPASHPALLDWLARDFRDHGYNLRQTIRGIVLSQTYSRSSIDPREIPPAASYFAVGRLKPLTPMQLAASLRIATRDPAGFAGMKPDERERQIESLVSGAAGFAAYFEEPGDDFQIGVAEALFFSNSDRIAQEFLNNHGGTLLGRLKTVTDPREAVTLLVRTVYGRLPNADEMKGLTDYLARRTDRTPEAYKQILWALLTASEFRFTY